jgi:hypothetical protein
MSGTDLPNPCLAMKKHTIALLSALALITSAAFAADSKAGKDCGDCQNCCSGSCEKPAKTADAKKTSRGDGANKTSDTPVAAKKSNEG